jgi:ParB family chromosome partitioning protein
MWVDVPESEAQPGESSANPGTVKVRSLAVAGTIRRHQRTILSLIPLAAIKPNRDQPRRHFSEEALAELAASIRTRGLLQPIVVCRADDGYELLAGERRFRASQRAGLDRVPALIRDGEDRLEIALIENLQREDLTPLEEAEGLATLIERHGYTHREVAELLGKSRPYVSNTLALNRLPESVKGDLHSAGLAVSRELLMGVARQESEEAALALWRRLKLDLMSVRRFRAERDGSSAERPAMRDVLLAARRLNRLLRRALREDVSSGTDQLARVLRRTESLVRRQLEALRRSASREIQSES